MGIDCAFAFGIDGAVPKAGTSVSFPQRRINIAPAPIMATILEKTSLMAILILPLHKQTATDQETE